MSPEIHVTELPQIPMETPLAKAQREAALGDPPEMSFGTPAHMEEMSAVEEVEESLGQKIQRYGQQLSTLATEHPLLTGLTGLGAGWLLNSLIRGPAPDEVETRSRFRPSVASTLLGIGIGWQASRMDRSIRSAGARANEMAHDVKNIAEASLQDTLVSVREKSDEMKQYFSEHPLMFALAAAGTGAVARRLLGSRGPSQQQITERVLKELERQGRIEANR